MAPNSMAPSLYQAPMGIDDSLEIEIENPDSVTVHTGDMEIEILSHAEGDFAEKNGQKRMSRDQKSLA